MSKKISIQIVDPQGAPIVGAAVTFQGQGPYAAWQLGGPTDAHGVWRFDTVIDGLTPALVGASAAGFVPWQEMMPIPAHGDWSYIRGLVAAPPAPHLQIISTDFVDAQGQPSCYSCCDLFPAMRMFLDGKTVELADLAAESLSYDFRWWRVLMMGDISQNTIFSLSPAEPNYYPQVRPFADFLNAHGIGLLAECYADNQVVNAPVPQHFQTVGDLLRGSTTILSFGNEFPKNGYDPQLGSDPGMIWSRGSSLADQLTPQNGASCASFHQRTDYPATVTDATASAIYMAEHGYTVLMMDEPTRFDENSNKSNVDDSELLAWQLARVYGTFWDLACFHNYCGQRGQLLTPNLRTVAAAWQRGLKG